MTVSENRAAKSTVSDEKIGKDEHILKSKDFRAVYKNGRSVKKAGFVLVVSGNGLGHNRLGFSISSSSIKRAVKKLTSTLPSPIPGLDKIFSLLVYKMRPTMKYRSASYSCTG